MNEDVQRADREEQSLVRMYMELTGTTEPSARSVFMFACETAPEAPATADRPGGAEAGHARPAVALALALLALGLAGPATAAEPGTATTSPPALITQPISLAEAVNLALKQNPDILKAKQDLEVSQGIVIETRAIALPRVVVTGNYSAVERADIDQVTIPASTNFDFNGLTLGNDQNWATQIKVVQSLYEGGRILSALRAARLTREQSMLNYQTTVADAVLNVEVAYFDVLLAQQQITVQEASVELLEKELGDTTRRFNAGTVPRFNVLRAEVELANARPRLIRARNSFHIAKNNLSNLLGFSVPRTAGEDIPLLLSGKLAAEPYDIDLQRAVAQALEHRTELRSLRKSQALRSEDIITAKAGYKPSLQAFAGYDTHNSTIHQDLGYTDHGWIAGVQLNWNLFDGLATQGRVKQATARYERAGVELEDTGRRIELEVRTAYSSFVEAQDVLASQKKAVEEAEEALRLARSRYEAGTGTQLDVLSAQTALTESRTTEIQALRDYAVARARLERAVGANVPKL